MAKRKDDEDNSQQPPKRLRPGFRVATARIRDASNASTFRDTLQASNSARPGDASGSSSSRNTSAASTSLSSTSRSSVSRITTLAVGASNKRLKAKHTQRSYTPAQPEPADANLSHEAGFQPPHEPVGATPSSAAKPKRKRNNNAQVRDFIDLIVFSI